MNKENKNTSKQARMDFAIQVFVGVAFLSIFFSPIARASEITADTVIKLVNQARKAADVPVLNKDSLLSKAADDKAKDMIKNDYFAHVSPEGKSPWYWIEQEGYDYHFAGENLAINFTDAEQQQKAWMDSPLHKENILSTNYEEIGVAIEKGIIDGHNTIVAVQMFGAPMEKIQGVAGSTDQVRQAQQDPAPQAQSAQDSNVQGAPIISSTVSSFKNMDVWKNNYATLAAWFGIFAAALVLVFIDAVTVFHRKHAKPVFLMHTAGRR